MHDGVKVTVARSVREELAGIDGNRAMSDEQKIDHKLWYLTKSVPKFLDNMLAGQEAMDSYLDSSKNKREAKSPLDHVNRIGDYTKGPHL